MTTTSTATAKARFIPAAGLRAQVGAVEIVAFWVNGAGWKVQTQVGYHATYSNLHQHEHQALAEYHALIEQHEAEQTTEVEGPTPATVETAPVVKLPTPAKGTTTKVTDPGHTVLAICSLNDEGRIERGGQPGQADVRLLTSLAKRHLVKLTYQEGRSDARKVVTGAVITNGGRNALAQLTAAEREAADMAARLAVIDRIQIAA